MHYSVQHATGLWVYTFLEIVFIDSQSSAYIGFKASLRAVVIIDVHLFSVSNTMSNQKRYCVGWNQLNDLVGRDAPYDECVHDVINVTYQGFVVQEQVVFQRQKGFQLILVDIRGHELQQDVYVYLGLLLDMELNSVYGFVSDFVFVVVFIVQVNHIDFMLREENVCMPT